LYDSHVCIVSHMNITEAIAWGTETVPVEIKPRWRPSQHEIVHAAITVIMLALVAIIALAGAAVLTMG
jgi:hypothetical protein